MGYLRGTRILTPTNEILVEDLKIDDLVVTRFNGIQPVKWIGRQSFPANGGHGRDRLPVRIKPGALADTVPARDLYVSASHAMLVDGQFLESSLLINGITVTQDHAPGQIDYFQIDLGRHDCIIAEGAWSETFADGPGQRDVFHNEADFADRYPDDPPPYDVSFCAPRPDHGRKLDAALRAVVARTTATIHPGPLRGCIDILEAPWSIYGWAQDEHHPELPVLVEILLGDEVIGTALACDHRQDLQDAGHGQGRCAFFVTSPVRLHPDILMNIRVRRVSDHAELIKVPSCIAGIEAAQQALRAPPGLRIV